MEPEDARTIRPPIKRNDLTRRKMKKNMKNDKSGFALMLSLPILIVGAVLIILFFVLSFVFMQKIIVAGIVFGAFYVMAKKGFNQQSLIAFGILIALIVILGFTGVLSLWSFDTSSSAFAVSPALLKVNPQAENGRVSMTITEVDLIASEELGVVDSTGITRMLTPQTYRRIDVNIQNKDPALPLVLKGASIMAVALPCENKTLMAKNYKNLLYLCNLKSGSNLHTTAGFFHELGTWLVQNNYRVGVSANSPNKWGLIKGDDLDYMSLKQLREDDETMVLWDNIACEMYGDQEELGSVGLYCSDMEADTTIKGVGYVYALRGANYGKYTIKVFLIEPVKPLSPLAYLLLPQKFISNLFGNDWRVLAVDTDYIRVVSPTVYILIMLGGIAIILFALWQFKVFG